MAGLIKAMSEQSLRIVLFGSNLELGSWEVSFGHEIFENEIKDI